MPMFWSNVASLNAWRLSRRGERLIAINADVGVSGFSSLSADQKDPLSYEAASAN
jgi:hypothetical protein